VRSQEYLDKDVYIGDEKIGKIKEIEINSENWKVTHLEVELTKDIAESVLGARKGGVRNMLEIAALDQRLSYRTDRGLNLKIPKEQLHMYIRPVV
jgi:sporulation protein YlmC with PRC-barrel domain